MIRIEVPSQILASQNPNPIPKPLQNENPKLSIKKPFFPFPSLNVPPPSSPSERDLIFREKILYLENLDVNSQKALRENPNFRSTPLSSLKSVEDFLFSVGINRSAMGRILDMLPELLTRDPSSDLYPILDFLLNEVGIPYHDVRKSIVRCPRLLLCSVDEQLRPTLCFLKSLGFAGHHSLNSQTTLLLMSSVENTLLPKIEFLQGLGFSYREVGNMVVRSPGLLTFSIENNLMPKVEYFLKEMNGNVVELKRFPQYFSFSLERKIKPRHGMLLEHGLSLPLYKMLKVSDDAFNCMLTEMGSRMVEGR